MDRLRRPDFMHVLINFTLRRDEWFVYVSADQERLPISPVRGVGNVYTLIRLLRYIGATEEKIDEVRENLPHETRGEIWVDLVPGRRNLLRIESPWADHLAVS